MMALFQKTLQKLICVLILVFPVSALTVTWVPIFNGGITIFVPVEQAVGTAVLREFEYDALGRLVKVEKDGSEVSDYSYDLAGNRTKVVENGVGESAGEGGIVTTPPDDDYTSPGSANVPMEPTNVSYWSTPGNTYVMDWDDISGATYYKVHFVDSITVQVEESYYSSSNSDVPNWVKACNANGCSAEVSF